MSLQSNLANYSFLSLLGSMVFYWIGTVFPSKETTKGTLWTNLIKTQITPKEASTTPNVNPSLLKVTTQNQGLIYSLTREEQNKEKKDSFVFSFSLLAKNGMIISNLLLASLLLLRWKESGHFPLSNLYESLMFLSWCFTGLHIFVENNAFLSVPSITNKKTFISILGAITTPSALLTNAFASFTLPKQMQEAAPLVPALQSNWLMMHVTVMILSYAALILGSLLSIAFLIITNKPSSIPVEDNWVNEQLEQPKLGETTITNKKNKREKIALILDNLSYRILGIGFPFLTIGILSGAVWANEAWGSYWSWDPKETWALLTWLVFAIYLHTRLSKGWEGRKPAIIASFGFIVVWMCYLGVNLLGEGLHSYGWVITS